MLGSKRPVFKPTAYGHGRRKRRIPRWLVLMITGMVLGAGGLLFIQKSYGPPKLTVEQSQNLHDEINSVKAESQRLQSQITLAERERTESLAKVESIQGSLENHDSIVNALKNDITLFADAMPADPRNTSPGIRAATLKNDEGKLGYTVLLMQDGEDTPMFKGTMNFNVMGRYPNGRNGYIDLDPIEVEFGRYEHAQGSVELPSSMVARQVTIQIFPEGSQREAARRIINVQ